MRIGLVIPWFGRDLKGGAEQHAWQLASRLAARGHSVNVLTTCCRSHQDDWSTNHLPASELLEPEGFKVRRFPVSARDQAAFQEVAARLQDYPPPLLKRGVSPVSHSDAQTFFRELIQSPKLLDHLRSDSETDRYILSPYLYGPIIDGISILGERAALVPCLHNEAYAYLPQVAESFYRAGTLLFISAGEMELATRLFGPGIIPKSVLVGGGIEANPGVIVPTDLATSKEHRPTGRYLLYLGRRERGKKVDLLLRAFARFRAAYRHANLQLCLAGHGTIAEDLPSGAIDLGLVSEPEKERLLRDCVALVQPSTNESFSRVIMEAWLHARPVAANRACLATAVAVDKAAGGWLASSEDEWAQLLADIDTATPEALNRLGENGRCYAEIVCDWDCVIDRLEEALQPKVVRAPSVSLAQFDGAQINQVLPNFSFGDAISTHALQLRDALVRLGIRSRIFAAYINPRVAHECEPFDDRLLQGSDVLIYHHSVGTALADEIQSFAGPKCLIYHNITPAEYYEPYWPSFAGVLRRGRDQLRDLAPHFPLAYGVSAYNRDELRAFGFRSPGILPIAVDPAQWASPADPAMMKQLQDGRTNILFVGRIAPNKRQDDLVKAFKLFLEYDHTARLILAGPIEAGDSFALELQNIIYSLALQEVVLLTDRISPAQLAACYRSADLFWSMSEHEGLGVPLIEAMWHDVPVLAFESSAIPETLGSAAVMFDDKSNFREACALAHLLTTDYQLRRKVIEAQRIERQRFLPETALSALEELIETLLGGGSAIQVNEGLRPDAAIRARPASSQSPSHPLANRQQHR